ncbi:glutaredoxin family protein, arsenate reductase [Halobacteroides halobius DSM 5150]|uniref:Glutaredoxin family protein, arsenate reductase n=1 Tax=Halobacteroides halobius (strain ATCC 35273 / DSM 5150 / MD-1) TaxID=748449 RepID=L0KCR3_HALHC|nr:redoxin family protein [Halobacteroides halobius]AGB42184.1 glutaredoxin family protein, arsenate reductase [Halobacteroides halobius DSM 5150]
MKKLIIFFIIFLLICGFLIGGAIKLILSFKNDNVAESEERYYLPKVTLNDLRGNEVQFHKIKEPTLLLFWLPDSSTCIKQLEILSEFKRTSNYNFDIISIGIGNLSKEKIKRLLNTKNIQFRTIIDSKTTLTKKLNVTAIPTVIFYKPYDKPITKVGLKKKRKLQKIINKYLLSN